ncbi:DUF3244 domain-containing protein [Aureispira anguillae]|uniref:DUF3244 domain-containing protein n=1 Tax=Aureispira anguillae TaxID=2864201 RepID=A0A915VK28_9BACT|nr:hypothetical protein [Aureispira anguillae]BDS09365.1 hypothetical protein AsAng_0000630 [Aureispira anguillae]
MSSLKFSFLFCSIWFLTNPMFCSIAENNHLIKTPILQQSEGGGIIVMDDVIMAITLNNAQDYMTNVMVLNANQDIVFQNNSCNSHSCSFDLSSLNKGSYTVIVNTNQKDAFAATISL